MVDDKSLPGPGWNEIIIRCNRKLEMLDPDYKILQIKEKFGTLRYYYRSDIKTLSIKEAMDRYVRQAEIESAKTCETCGKEGTITNRKMGWMKTRCSSCAVTGAFEAMSS
jgi:formylmethanofuran dehydrogenase subunit E